MAVSNELPLKRILPMAIAEDLSLLLVRELRAFQREVELFPDDESVWRVMPGIANSAGNLALHVSGNLRYFVGAVLGGRAYVRDRADEFGRRAGTRLELVADLEAAIGTVMDILPHVAGERFDCDFPEPVGGTRLRTGLFMLHLCAHAAYHLGQAGYLRRTLTQDNNGSGALPLQPLTMK
jgi:hypothetical protein